MVKIRKNLQYLIVSLVLLPFMTWKPTISNPPNNLISAQNHQQSINVIHKLSVGSSHSCVILGQSVYCWGYNRFGQIGDGTTIDRTSRVRVHGLEGYITDLSAGLGHTCAVVNGAARCWGLNNYGQLGDGTTITRTIPVTVAGLDNGVLAISAGFEHTCALMQGMSAKCWGRNDAGQLGDGTAGNIRTIPVNVVGLGNSLVLIKTGWSYTCGLTAEGMVKCWGTSWRGQLGRGNTVGSALPVDVIGLTKEVTDISTGTYHACASFIDGTMKCWGANDYGQLGDGTIISRLSPVDVQGLGMQVNEIAAGDLHTCAVLHGGAKCWGRNNFGQIGDGSHSNNRLMPTNVVFTDNEFVDIGSGAVTTCALMKASEIMCWGGNGAGQVGDGTTTFRPLPVYTLAPSKIYLFALYPEACIPIQQKC